MEIKKYPNYLYVKQTTKICFWSEQKPTYKVNPQTLLQ